MARVSRTRLLIKRGQKAIAKTEDTKACGVQSQLRKVGKATEVDPADVIAEGLILT